MLQLIPFMLRNSEKGGSMKKLPYAKRGRLSDVLCLMQILGTHDQASFFCWKKD
jgi:hypothetical protein